MCRIFYRKKKVEQLIPSAVSSSERLLRFVLSPLHINKQGLLRSNAFNPTVGTNEISVTRLEFSSVETCKRLAHKMDKIDKGVEVRKYNGFCLLNKNIALSCGAKDVIGSPKEDNPAHADIIVEEIMVYLCCA